MQIIPFYWVKIWWFFLMFKNMFENDLSNVLMVKLQTIDIYLGHMRHVFLLSSYLLWNSAKSKLFTFSMAGVYDMVCICRISGHISCQLKKLSLVCPRLMSTVCKLTIKTFKRSLLKKVLEHKKNHKVFTFSPQNCLLQFEVLVY